MKRETQTYVFVISLFLLSSLHALFKSFYFCIFHSYIRQVGFIKMLQKDNFGVTEMAFLLSPN